MSRGALLALAALLAQGCSDKSLHLALPDAVLAETWVAAMALSEDGAILASTGLHPPGEPLNLSLSNGQRPAAVEVLGFPALPRMPAEPAALAADPIYVSPRCTRTLPAPTAAAVIDGDTALGLAPASLGNLSADWLEKSCRPGWTSSITADIRCIRSSCPLVVQDQGNCLATVDASACGRGTFEVRPGNQGPCVTRPSGGCGPSRAQHFGGSSLTCEDRISCEIWMYQERSLDWARVDQRRTLIPGANYQPPANADGTGVDTATIRSGWFSSAELVGDSLWVVTRPVGPEDGKGCAQRARRLVALDADLNPLFSAALPSCFDVPRSIPEGVLGTIQEDDRVWVGLLDLAGAMTASVALGTFTSSISATAISPYFPSTGEVVVAVSAGADGRASSASIFAVRTADLRVRSLGSFVGDVRFVVRSGTTYALVSDEQDFFASFDQSTGDKRFEQRLPSANSVSAGDLSVEPTASLFVSAVPEDEQTIHVFTIDGYLGSAEIIEDGAVPYRSVSWPGVAGGMVVASLVSVHRPRPYELGLNRFSPAEPTTIPGRLILGTGAAGSMLTKGKYLYLTLPWTAEVLRLQLSP
ncbi:MAG: hypothetical protein U1E65_29955 [Myxococcota bacterium]